MLYFARQIYFSYGDLDGDDLERLNHTEMPWLKARGNLKPWQNCERVISEDDMKEYYLRGRTDMTFNELVEMTKDMDLISMKVSLVNQQRYHRGICKNRDRCETGGGRREIRWA